MPIDPNIALSVKAPEVENPVDSFGRVLSLKNLMQQGQLHQQQMEENRLKMQQQRDAMAGDDALAGLYAQHAKSGPDGGMDWDAVETGLAQQGHGKLAQSIGTQRRAEQRLALDDHQKKFTLARDQNKMAGELVGPIANASADTAPEDLESMYQTARQSAARAGLDMKAHPETLLNPDGTPNPAAVNHVVGLYHGAMGAEQQAVRHQADLDFAQKLVEFKDKVASGAPDTEKKWLSYVAGLASAAGDQQHWDAALLSAKKAGAPDTVLSQFDKDYSPDAVTRAANLGMSPEQREAAGQRKDSADALAAYRDESLALRAEVASRERGQTANSQAVDRRQAVTEIDKFNLEESKLNRMRLQLGQAIGSGAVYISPTGVAKSMKDAAKENDETTAGMIADMVARYRQATDELHQLIPNKYNVYGRLGVTPTVPLADIHAAIDAGDAKLKKKYPDLFGGAAPAAGPPAAPAGSAPPTAAPATATAAAPPASPYAKPGSYTTALSPAEESQFQAWAKTNKVPWRDEPNADYDMRGFWKAAQSGDPAAKQQLSNGHYPDTYKTPYHKTFSNESKYATPDAPRWQGDKLVDKSGNVVADETPKPPTKTYTEVQVRAAATARGLNADEAVKKARQSGLIK